MLLTITTISATLFFAFAAYTDLRLLRIPNSTCIAVAVLGLVRLLLIQLLFDDLATTLYTIASAIIVFLIGFVLSARRIVGGGDAKLLTGTVLLVGYHDLCPFFLAMSIFGAILATVILTLKYSFPSYRGQKLHFVGTTKTVVPYGVAIGVAGGVILITQLYISAVPLVSSSTW